jgi:outer membrane lipoprotein-sorting protein
MNDHDHDHDRDVTRRRLLLGGLALGAGLCLPSLAWADDERPPKESPEFVGWVMDRMDDMHRGLSSHGVMTMQVKTEHFTRSLKMESWSRGEDYSLVLILAPKKEKGTATLKAGDDLFTYLAKTGRTIKISGAMMGSAWMGSHLTNNDLVKAARTRDHYDVTLTQEGTLEGKPHYVFLATPKPDAAVVWGKIEIAIRQDDLMPTRQIFFDEDGTAVRAIEVLDDTERNGRPFAKNMLVRPLDGSGEYTRIAYEEIEFDVKLPTSMFTVQHLKSL